jgi:hypothetical protein
MTTSKAAAPSVLTYLAFCQQHEGEMLSLLRRMVEIESPSDDKTVGWPTLSPGVGEGRGIKVRKLFWGSAFEFGQNSHFFSLARCPFRLNLNHTFHPR